MVLRKGREKIRKESSMLKRECRLLQMWREPQYTTQNISREVHNSRGERQVQYVCRHGIMGPISACAKVKHFKIASIAIIFTLKVMKDDQYVFTFLTVY